MIPQEFVEQLRAAVVGENLGVYKNLFSSSSMENTSDAYWKRALVFFNSLTESQRVAFFEIVRQVAVDTTSNILGVIDGVSSLENDGDFYLTAGESGKINGDLQSLFLAKEEIRNTTL